MSEKVISLSYTNPRNPKVTIQLTGSKSECNRALILAALSKGKVKLENFSDAHDTQILKSCLDKISSQNSSAANPLCIDIGPAGTAMRFLTAYLCLQKGPFILTGTARMQQRPIQLLVEALQSLGAEIKYAAEPGYPPLEIAGNLKQLKTHISIPGNISSQYLSALLLIGSQLPLGLTLSIENEITSKPYLDMTLALLKEVGINIQWKQNSLIIPPQDFKEAILGIEPDWSAASYWYSILASLPEGEIILPYLKENSLQGDSAIVHIMKNFGVKSTFSEQGLTLKKGTNSSSSEIHTDHINFITCPDIAQSIIVLCAVLKIPYYFSGLETLKIKETNRIEALQVELKKIGAHLFETEPGVYYLETKNIHFPDSVRISTYEDHRMAMAFAVLATRIKEVIFDDKEVVNKSYPNFWKDLEKIGFIYQ